MGSCVSKNSRTIKTCPDSSSKLPLQEDLISTLVSLQHLSNNLTVEIEKSIFSNQASLLVLLKQKQAAIKSAQLSIQSLLSKLDDFTFSLNLNQPISPSRPVIKSKTTISKLPSDLSSSCNSLLKHLKSSPIFDPDLSQLIKSSDLQLNLKKSLSQNLKNLDEIEFSALSELKNHQDKVKSGGLIRKKYKPNNMYK